MRSLYSPEISGIVINWEAESLSCNLSESNCFVFIKTENIMVDILKKKSPLWSNTKFSCSSTYVRWAEDQEEKW